MPVRTIHGIAVGKIQLTNAETGVDKSLRDSDNADIKCDARVEVKDADGNTYYLPLYDSTT